MDIEDLFNESNYPLEEKKEEFPLVIPEFDPCTGGDPLVSSTAAS